MLPRNKTPKAAHFAPIGEAMVITDLSIHLHHGLGPEAFGQSFLITLDQFLFALRNLTVQQP
jgi:hypothetical protein